MVGVEVSHRGKGAMRIVDPGTKIDKEAYLELLRNMYVPDTVRIFRPGAPEGYSSHHFAQDNAPSHTAKVVKEYMREQQLDVLL